MRVPVSLVAYARRLAVLGLGLLVLDRGDAETGSPANRLIHETSPYLRQHAHNPVDWYPWGPEALARARAENKPIFLSIGYSTCHWCHVMERESFADPLVAARLNRNFVCIKVDREERPDLDRVYMRFLQASTGQGGWPLNVWLTPDLKPFFAGTYFPPDSRPGRPGFGVLIDRIADLWARQGDEVVAKAEQTAEVLAADSADAEAAVDLTALRARCFDVLRESADRERGGFGGAPKFPEPAKLEFLLDYAVTAPEAEQRREAAGIALGTLRALARGALHDPLGGGFHRYAVDVEWRVPHFEKMLYDQAQLASAFLKGWQLERDPLFEHTARRVLDYVRHHLTGPDGGFYSAEDAESSEGRGETRRAEGAYYVWDARELGEHLSAEEEALVSFIFNVIPAGNVPVDQAPELAGRNVLSHAETLAAAAARFGEREPVLAERLERALSKLRQSRAERPRPARDDKVIAAWNGLMISAFAQAARILDEPPYAEIAVQAAEHVRAHLVDPATGRLARSHRGGIRSTSAFAEDYAALVQGLLDLYEATFEVRWIEWARDLQVQQDALFWDDASGGYFATISADTSVLWRLKEDHDGAEPSANSIALRNLVRFSVLLHDEAAGRRASQCLAALAPVLHEAPAALPALLAAGGWLERPAQLVILQGEHADPGFRSLDQTVRRAFLPRTAVLRVNAADRAYWQAHLPIVEALPADPAMPAMAYVCENFTCQLPTGDPAVLRRLLGSPARDPHRRARSTSPLLPHQ